MAVGWKKSIPTTLCLAITLVCRVARNILPDATGEKGLASISVVFPC